MGTLHKDKYNFFTISRSILLIMRNALDKYRRESKKRHFISNGIFFFKNLFIYEIQRRNIVEPDGLEILIKVEFSGQIF